MVGKSANLNTTFGSRIHRLGLFGDCFGNNKRMCFSATTKNRYREGEKGPQGQCQEYYEKPAHQETLPEHLCW